ncbi:AP-5 complex subunit mu-1-like [Patiria miniata]|uniref:AP-5 complex subunit mu-1 n=1 Tax=Patiria miniata TaxID=46514 RepID=A0A914BFS6_PATMI|nr:AP-5 complex subunit mu-1-like [Patiria miniata]XP_038074939.1 AP-5 complex subunit mu-1-like [Patiria miniata]
MSFRAVWVLPLPGSGPEDLIFIKTYPTVEKRALVFNGPENHVSLPSDGVLYDATLEELGLKQSGTKYVDSRDTCDKEFQKPVFEIKVLGGKLWPVVIIQKFGLLFCCLPLVEQSCEPRPPLIEILGVSLGLSLLSAIADFMGHLPKDFNASHPKVLELYSYMCQAAPFGTLIDSNPTTVREAIQNKHSTQLVAAHAKQPAWRPVMTKGKGQLHFTITEQVRAVLYNSSNMEDVCSVYGSISCKADLEGATPEVSVAVIVPHDSPPLDNLIVHPCVQGGDTQIISSGMPGLTSQATPAKLTRRRLRFIPPREPFTLGYYASASSTPTTPPISATYQMRGTDREVTLTVKVKLSSKVKNALEYCEVQLPFYNRGIITEIDPVPSMGSVVLPNDRRRLGWNLGARFPTRSLEATLQAKVQFAEYDEKRQSSTYEDPFCVGLNAYAMIYFKVPDYTHTGCQIDPKSVQIHPSAKPKLNLVREFTSAEYKVWNSHGDAQAVFPVPKYLLH